MTMLLELMPNCELFDVFVGLVALLGTACALLSDEVFPQYWVLCELLPIPHGKYQEVESVLATLRGYTTSAIQDLLRQLLSIPAKIAAIVTSASRLVGTTPKKVRLLLLVRRFRKIARSLNHMTVLMVKNSLNMPIRPGETEVESYLDLKRNFGDSWPFMWEMRDVKDETVSVSGTKAHIMSSYSYLDFLRDERVQEAAIAAARQYATGNHGPRMLGGNTHILRQLESKLAAFFGREGCLVVSAGFLACMSCIIGVARKGDLLFVDSRAHASLRTGLKLCGGKVVYFKHHDYKDAERMIKKHLPRYRGKRVVWMVVESIYSMDGDIAHLPSVWGLCQKYDMKLIIDEAHGLGVLGKTGRGLEEYYGLPGIATLICGTFSKSLASVGGYIVGSHDLIEFLDFHSPGNVFSAPCSAYHAGAAMKALELIDAEPWRITETQEMAKYLRNALETGNGLWPAEYPDELKWELEGDEDSVVIPVVFPDDPDRMLLSADKLRRKGYMVSAVCAPACPLRRPRFRITANYALTKEVVDDFVRVMVETIVEMPQYVPKDLF